MTALKIPSGKEHSFHEIVFVDIKIIENQLIKKRVLSFRC